MSFRLTQYGKYKTPNHMIFEPKEFSAMKITMNDVFHSYSLLDV